MIVKNEERFLAQCLQSIADTVDEICIVDTGSTDRTIEIATSFGARIEHREWRNDFAWARNEAIAMATRRWIIMLDADEELTPESKPALLQLKSALAYHTGGWVRCFNQADDYGGTGAMSHVLVRVFPNNDKVRFRGMIHEFVTYDNSTSGLTAVQTPIAIIHHGYLKDIVESRGKAERNLAIVKAAVEADPSDPFAWFNLGSTAFMMGNFETARDALEKMRQLNGTTARGFIANGLAILAETYSDKLGDAVQGEMVALEALRFSPHYANAHFQLGKAFVAQQRFKEARDAYGEAIADKAFANQQFVIDDQVYTWKAHSEIGSTYVMEGDDASAIEWFRRGLENAPGVQPLMLNLARALERSGQTTEAGALFMQAHERFRDDFSTVDYVNFLLRRENGQGALDVIDDSHQRISARTVVPLLIAAAQVAMKLGRNDDILRYLELAALRAPGNADVLNELERIYKATGNTEGLARILDREAQTEPVAPADFLRRSYQANARADYATGLQLAQRGLELAPEDAHLSYNAAVAAAGFGDHKLALTHLERLWPDHDPTYLPGLSLKARILRADGRDDEALAVIEAILLTDPINVEALVTKAALSEARGDLARAEGTLRDLTFSNAARGAVELSAFLLRQGRFEEAARIADAALQR